MFRPDGSTHSECLEGQVSDIPNVLERVCFGSKHLELLEFVVNGRFAALRMSRMGAYIPNV